MNSVDAFVGKAIAASPKGAFLARFSLGVVNAFFMGAANDTVGYNHGFGSVCLQEV